MNDNYSYSLAASKIINSRNNQKPMHTPFDPLQFLYSLYLDLSLSPDGQITVKGLWSLPPHQQKKAKAVLKTYNNLLRLQLDASNKRMRPSVRKLLAQGKIEIRDGHYVRVGIALVVLRISTESLFDLSKRWSFNQHLSQ